MINFMLCVGIDKMKSLPLSRSRNECCWDLCYDHRKKVSLDLPSRHFSSKPSCPFCPRLSQFDVILCY